MLRQNPRVADRISFLVLRTACRIGGPS